MREWVARTVLVLVSVALVCAGAEVALRLAGWVPIHDVYSRPEQFWRHDDRLGWSLEPGARGRYVGPRPFPVEFDNEVAINSIGLRGPEVGAREPGELRLLVLGDSMVAGFEVPERETFVALLEERLRERFTQPVRVINGGVRGYGNDQTLLWYRERAAALRPDVVVLLFSANDFEDNVTLHRAKRPFGKGAFALAPDGSLSLVGVPVPRYDLCSSWVLDERYRPARVDGPVARASCWVQTRGADRSALFTAVSSLLARVPGLVKFLKESTDARGTGAVEASFFPFGASDDERARREAALATALLRELAREVRRSGARFVLVIAPTHWERLDARALAEEGVEGHTVLLPRSLEPWQIQFRNDSHWNALGHRVFAEGLLRLVEPELRELSASPRTRPAPG